MFIFDKDNFEAEVLQAEGYVFVDYWREGCEPCKALMPDVEKLSETFSGSFVSFFIFSLRHCNFCYSAAKLQKNI